MSGGSTEREAFRAAGTVLYVEAVRPISRMDRSIVVRVRGGTDRCRGIRADRAPGNSQIGMIQMADPCPGDGNPKNHAVINFQHDQWQIGQAFVEDDLHPVETHVPDPVQFLDSVMEFLKLPQPPTRCRRLCTSHSRKSLKTTSTTNCSHRGCVVSRSTIDSVRRYPPTEELFQARRGNKGDGNPRRVTEKRDAWVP